MTSSSTNLASSSATPSLEPEQQQEPQQPHSTTASPTIITTTPHISLHFHNLPNHTKSAVLKCILDLQEERGEAFWRDLHDEDGDENQETKKENDSTEKSSGSPSTQTASVTNANGAPAAVSDSTQVTIREHFIEDPSGILAYQDQVPHYETQAKLNSKKPQRYCWNCESPEHELRECPHRRNHARIRKNRDIFMESKRGLETERFYKAKSTAQLLKEENLTTPPTPLREEMEKIDKEIKEQSAVPLKVMGVKDTALYSEKTHIPFDLLGTVVEETANHKAFRRICSNLKERTKEKRRVLTENFQAEKDGEKQEQETEAPSSIRSGSDFVKFTVSSEDDSNGDSLNRQSRKRGRSHELSPRGRNKRRRDAPGDYGAPEAWRRDDAPYGYAAPPPYNYAGYPAWGGYPAPPSYPGHHPHPGPPPAYDPYAPPMWGASYPPPGYGHHQPPPPSNQHRKSNSFQDRLNDIKRQHRK